MNKTQKAYKSLLIQDYGTYCKKVNIGFKQTKFHRYLCDTVQEFLELETGHAYDILIISCPPQHGKSLTISETLPSWYLGRNPTHRVIEISYSEDFAQRFGRRNREKINEYGGKIFGIGLAESPNTATEFEMYGKHGGMMSRGIGSAITGNPAELMIIDDPVKNRQDADSESQRRRIWEEWNDSMRTRLSAGAKVIVIMTRWHEDDLAGRLVKYEKNVKVINIPLEAEENDVLGRKVGDALCPEIGKDNSWLVDFKEGITSKEGSRTWNALYQGHPTAAEGNLIQREWWNYYTTLPPIVDWVMSVDATFKDGDNNDYVAISVWGKTEANIYLIDLVKKHLDFPSTVREILRLRAMYKRCKITLIEDKANGSAIIQVLRTKLTGIIPVEPKGGKVARVNAISGAIESGNVYLPENKHFTADFVEECAAFPNGAHDDCVDSMSQALNRLIYHNSKLFEEKRKTTLESLFHTVKKKTSSECIGKGERINVI